MTACAVFATCVFTACGDDDPATPGNPDPTGSLINPNAVFTGKRVGNFDGNKMTYNEEGLLTKIESTYETVTFTYPTATRSAGNTGVHVIMTIKGNDPVNGGKTSIDMTIGKNGFVESAIETYDDDPTDTDTWGFKYNEEGQLNWMKRSEGDNEITTITYKDGDITKVEVSDDEYPEPDRAIIAYGSNPSENKGCIMLFDETFSIDMDEMWYAYWAGLLGKATKHLPVSQTFESTWNGTTTKSTYKFEWNFTIDGYPKDMTINDTDNSTPETIRFGW